MQDDQSQQEPQDGGRYGGRTIDDRESSAEVIATVQATIVLPIAEWDRIPYLKLAPPGDSAFAQARHQASQGKDDIDRVLDGRPSDVRQAVKTHEDKLRHLLRKGDAPGGHEDNATPSAFLWGASFLLAAYAEALQNSNPSSLEIEHIRRVIKRILSDMVLASENPPTPQPQGVQPQAYPCGSCYTRYQTCKAAPGANLTTCLNNYNLCTSTCY